MKAQVQPLQASTHCVLCNGDEMGIPVKYIGVGEQVDDLQLFEPRTFAAALVSE